MPQRTLLVMLVLAMACSGGDSVPFTDRCNVKIVTITPPLATLHVGDNLTLSVAYTPGVSSECLPAVPATSLQWSTDDSLTVSVDPLTGTVTARRAGSTLVWVHVPGGNAGVSKLGGAQVTVTGP